MFQIRPRPNVDSDIPAPASDIVRCGCPVRFVKFRYPHHNGRSGYSRICDYIDAPVIRRSAPLHALGETLARPATALHARSTGMAQYNRHDSIYEVQVLADFLTHRDSVYHFIYAEKSYHLAQHLPRGRGNVLVGTVHHPADQQRRLIQDHSHFRRLDHIISMDRASVPWWREVTGKDNVVWIPNGVDTSFFHPSDRQPDDAFHVGFAGAHERDFASLTQVVATCEAEAPHVRFHIVGGSEPVMALGRAHRNVTIHTRLSDEDYRDLLQGLDLLFLPLLMSTVCNVVLEAMACGVPVVTSKGGIEDYLDEACAIVCDPGDAAAMAQAVLAQAGPGQGGRLSRPAARARAENFSWAQCARRHVEFYESVCGRS